MSFILKTHQDCINRLAAVFFFLLLCAGSAKAGEELYNGIVLPDQWPPSMEHLELVEVRDPHNPNPQWADVTPQLCNVDAVAYESLILGGFSIW